MHCVAAISADLAGDSAVVRHGCATAGKARGARRHRGNRLSTTSPPRPIRSRRIMRRPGRRGPDRRGQGCGAGIVIEKPFGRDLGLRARR
ncbi:MAG: hypothetical protein MZV49_21705 [Rhodopseudomonas palustris]|nr:hypothetical protein [Rhodopseudomonas palustris]